MPDMNIGRVFRARSLPSPRFSRFVGKGEVALDLTGGPYQTLNASDHLAHLSGLIVFDPRLHSRYTFPQSHHVTTRL